MPSIQRQDGRGVSHTPSVDPARLSILKANVNGIGFDPVFEGRQPYRTKITRGISTRRGTPASVVSRIISVSAS